MKLTLVFGIFNKAYHLDRLLSSWLDTLSKAYQYEVIVICDACVDASQEIAQDTLSRYGDVLESYQIVDTPDVYEIEQNNTALALAAGDSDLILFIQDDNFMLDEAWDAHLLSARLLVKKPGCTALLAGGVFLGDGRQFKRIESQRPHKGEHFTKHGIEPSEYPPAVYSVDFITRPFAVSTPLLREMGGLGGEGWDVICWDDTDLSIKLLKAGYVNQYVALDVLNFSTGQSTMPERLQQGFSNNHKHFMAAHHEWLVERSDNAYKFQYPLTWATTED